jgi:hypothetical protein
MDTKCRVCGEPYDYWGARHGDMTIWEWKLFRAGAGCPCCEGVVPEGGKFEPKTIEDCEIGDEDPMDFILASESTVKWVKPEAKVIATCECCGTRIIEDLDAPTDGDTKPPHIWDVNTKTPGWFSIKNKLDDFLHSIHSYWGKDGPKVCPACVGECDNCGKEILDGPDSDTLCPDVYSPGWSAQAPDGAMQVWCIECHENYSEDDPEEDDLNTLNESIQDD